MHKMLWHEQEIKHLRAEVRTKEQALADYSRQLEAERAQVEELETSLLMQVGTFVRISCPQLSCFLTARPFALVALLHMCKCSLAGAMVAKSLCQWKDTLMEFMSINNTPLLNLCCPWPGLQEKSCSGQSHTIQCGHSARMHASKKGIAFANKQ